MKGGESFWFYFVFFSYSSMTDFPFAVSVTFHLLRLYSFSAVRPRVACVRALIAVGTLASVPWTFTTIRSFVYKIDGCIGRKRKGRKREDDALDSKKRMGGVILRGATPTLDFRRDKLTEAYDTSWPFVECKTRGCWGNA